MTVHVRNMAQERMFSRINIMRELLSIPHSNIITATCCTYSHHSHFPTLFDARMRVYRARRTRNISSPCRVIRQSICSQNPRRTTPTGHIFVSDQDLRLKKQHERKLCSDLHQHFIASSLIRSTRFSHTHSKVYNNLDEIEAQAQHSNACVH